MLENETCLSRSESEMTLEELKIKFSHMMRHCTPEHARAIEASGPLSTDSFYRERQKLYRRIVALEHGVVLSEQPGGIIHHPV